MIRLNKTFKIIFLFNILILFAFNVQAQEIGQEITSTINQADDIILNNEPEMQITSNEVRAEILNLIKEKILVIYEKIQVLEEENKEENKFNSVFQLSIAKVKLDLIIMINQGFSVIDGKILEFRPVESTTSTSTETGMAATSTTITATSTTATTTSTSATSTETISIEESQTNVRSGGGPAVIVDTIAPSAINDLSASNQSITTIDLNWTSPGDNNNDGTATSYDIRYSTILISANNWASATQVQDEPTPLLSGATQTLTVTGLNYSTKYYFAIRSSDEIENESDISNIVNKTTNEAGECDSSVASGAQTYYVRSDSEPGILQADINPLDVAIGSDQTVTVRMWDANDLEVTSIEGIVYTDNGSQSFDLSLNSGDAIRGYWQGTWSPQDTLCTIYMMRIEATGGSGTSNIELSFR